MALKRVVAYVKGPVRVGKGNVYYVSSESYSDGCDRAFARLRDLTYSYFAWQTPCRKNFAEDLERDLKRRVDGAPMISVEEIGIKIKFRD